MKRALNPTAKRPELTQGPITQTLIVFALPVLGGNVLQALNGSVNQFWVSHSLGLTAITAIGNANIVMMLLLGVVFGVSMAANILIAQNVGSGDMAMVKRVMGTSVTFFVLLSLTVAALGYFASPRILQWMGTPGEAREEAEIYLRIVFLAMPFMYFFAFLQMAQRGAGDSRTPFYFMVMAVAIDIALNPLLIRGIGPFPRLGIAGSAISTFVAQGTSLAVLIALLYCKRGPLALRWQERRLLWPSKEILRSLILRGLPMGLQILVMSGAALVMIRYVNAYGATTAAAFTSSSQVWTFVQMPAMALGAAVSSMAAQNIGAQRWDRVAGIARSGVWSGLLVTGVISALIYALGDQTLRLFLPPASDAIPIARHINEIVLWGFVLFSITFILSGVVRATGAVWVPLLILAVSMYAIRIPFAAMLKDSLGADSIWWSFPLGTIVSALLTSAYYLQAGWKNSRMLVGAQPAGHAPDAGLTTPSIASADATGELSERIPPALRQPDARAMPLQRVLTDEPVAPRNIH